MTGKIDGEGGLFAQDRWTMDRVTLNLGVRLDCVQRQHSRLSPVAVAHHAAPQLRRAGLTQSVRQKDCTPKVGAAWDVLGDGKTALKVNFAKYVLGQSLVASNPLIALSAVTSRR